MLDFWHITSLIIIAAEQAMFTVGHSRREDNAALVQLYIFFWSNYRITYLYLLRIPFTSYFIVYNM